jgi:hypothetical protein
MSIWVHLKFGMEEKNGVWELIKKFHLEPLRIFGENLKTSPTGKFTVHVVTSAANSNSLTNLSYGRAANYQVRFEWSPRCYLDMRDMCSIYISSRMTYFERHLS